MRAQHMPGFIRITSLIKPARLIKLMAVIMDLDARHPLSAETVLHTKDAGPKKELKFIVLRSMEMSTVKKI
jgi:hypothetical protein